MGVDYILVILYSIYYYFLINKLKYMNIWQDIWI